MRDKWEPDESALRQGHRYDDRDYERTRPTAHRPPPPPFPPPDPWRKGRTNDLVAPGGSGKKFKEV